jgi:F-type H+-transporting ATPase subunit c
MILQSAKLIGAGLSTIALAGVGAGIGIVFSSLVTSVARNPSMNKQLFAYTILGFALTEAIALFALMMAFLILFSF